MDLFGQVQRMRLALGLPERRQAQRAAVRAAVTGVTGEGGELERTRVAQSMWALRPQDPNAVGVAIGTQHPGHAAILAVRQAMADYYLPVEFRTRYLGMQRFSGRGAHDIDEGIIHVEMNFRTISGIDRTLEVPVIVKGGRVLEPAIVIDRGEFKVMAQSTFDEMLERGTFYVSQPTRENMYSPPPEDRRPEKRVPLVRPGMYGVGPSGRAFNAAYIRSAVQGHYATDLPPFADYQAAEAAGLFRQAQSEGDEGGDDAPRPGRPPDHQMIPEPHVRRDGGPQHVHFGLPSLEEAQHEPLSRQDQARIKRFIEYVELEKNPHYEDQAMADEMRELWEIGKRRQHERDQLNQQVEHDGLVGEENQPFGSYGLGGFSQKPVLAEHRQADAEAEPTPEFEAAVSAAVERWCASAPPEVVEVIEEALYDDAFMTYALYSATGAGTGLRDFLDPKYGRYKFNGVAFDADAFEDAIAQDPAVQNAAQAAEMAAYEEQATTEDLVDRAQRPLSLSRTPLDMRSPRGPGRTQRGPGRPGGPPSRGMHFDSQLDDDGGGAMPPGFDAFDVFSDDEITPADPNARKADEPLEVGDKFQVSRYGHTWTVTKAYGSGGCVQSDRHKRKWFGYSHNRDTGEIAIYPINQGTGDRTGDPIAFGSLDLIEDTETPSSDGEGHTAAAHDVVDISDEDRGGGDALDAAEREVPAKGAGDKVRLSKAVDVVARDGQRWHLTSGTSGVIERDRDGTGQEFAVWFEELAMTLWMKADDLRG